MKSRFLTLLLGMAMSACIGQEVLFSSLPQTIVPGQQRREVQPLSATLRNEGIGPLDSIKVWDNQTGQLISRKAFKYDQTGRIIRNETFTAEHSIPYTLEELLYPGNDTLVIMTRSFRKYWKDDWGLATREIYTQVDSPNIQYLALDWEPGIQAWMPFDRREEEYNQDGSFRFRLQFEKDIFSDMLIPTRRDRPVYNKWGRTAEYLFETDYDQDGVWDPSTRWVYGYILDTILHHSTLQYWNSTLNTWTNNRLVQWDWLNSGTMLIQQSAQWDNSIGDWYLFQTSVIRKNEFGQDLSKVAYEGPWLGLLVPEDSVAWEYDAEGQVTQSIYFTWDTMGWKPYHLYRYGRNQCMPYPGRLDSVWVWNEPDGDWQLGGYESCHSIQGPSLIIEVDSLHQEYSWQNVDMKLHYYYQDSTYVAPPPIDSSSLQDCIYMNPYLPGSPITCFADLGLPLGQMNIAVVNLLGRVIHQDRHEVGLPFTLPATTPQGLYVLEVSIPSGPHYSGLIYISF